VAKKLHRYSLLEPRSFSVAKTVSVSVFVQILAKCLHCTGMCKHVSSLALALKWKVHGLCLSSVDGIVLRRSMKAMGEDFDKELQVWVLHKQEDLAGMKCYRTLQKRWLQQLLARSSFFQTSASRASHSSLSAYLPGNSQPQPQQLFGNTLFHKDLAFHKHLLLFLLAFSVWKMLHSETARPCIYWDQLDPQYLLRYIFRLDHLSALLSQRRCSCHTCAHLVNRTCRLHRKRAHSVTTASAYREAELLTIFYFLHGCISVLMRSKNERDQSNLA